MIAKNCDGEIPPGEFNTEDGELLIWPTRGGNASGDGKI